MGESFINLLFYLFFMSLIKILEKAKGLEVQGKYKEADDVLSMAITQLQSSQRPDIAKLLNQRGIVRRMLERYDDSFKDYESALKVEPEKEQKALAYMNMADIYRVAKKDFGEAHTSLDEALTYAGNSTLMHAKAVDQRGLVFIAQKEHDSAIASYKKARDICEKLLKEQPENQSIQNRLGQIIHHLGVAYVLSEDPSKVDEAYNSQLSALETFTKLGDQQGIVNTITTIGKIALIKNNPGEAIAQYEKAWVILQKTKYNRAIIGLALDLAEAYLKKGDLIKAKPYLERGAQGLKNHELTKHDLDLIQNQISFLKEYMNPLT
jgi:tetratricopeptide (TPR) repeat protein